jgi:hypothetical protein
VQEGVVFPALHELLPTVYQAGAASADVATPQGSTVAQTIGLLYGSAVKKELIEVKAGSASSSQNENADGHDDDNVDQQVISSPYNRRIHH